MTWKRLSTALRKRPSFLLAAAVAAAVAHADIQRRDPGYPVFVASHDNPNEYDVFATSGWDGNWFVGSTSVWIQKLPRIPPGRYAHAFIGAKLGRMKTLPPAGKPPVFEPVPGEVWMGLSSQPAWSDAQRQPLTTTADIPLEGSAEYPINHAGEAQWFWTEVPLERVQTKGDNYLVLWSPTPGLTSVSSAPVLAAALGGQNPGSWLINSSSVPVTAKNPPGSALNFFEPALAMKLIPVEVTAPLPTISLVSWEGGSKDHPNPILTASILGASVEKAWVEFLSAGTRHGDVVIGAGWHPVGRPLWKAPYIFTIDQNHLPAGNLKLRVVATDVWERRAASDSFSIAVSTAVPTSR